MTTLRAFLGVLCVGVAPAAAFGGSLRTRGGYRYKNESSKYDLLDSSVGSTTTTDGVGSGGGGSLSSKNEPAKYDLLDTSVGSTTTTGNGGTSSGDFVGCIVDGNGAWTGDCTDVSACQANGGTAYPGYCPGPSNIQCCLNGDWGSCTAGGQSGSCIGRDTCLGEGKTPISGACPGPIDIQCCVTGGGPSPSSGSIDKVVQFASATWDCDGGSPPCVGCSTVPAGSSQTPYGCAPWVAQALAAGGFIPGLSGCMDISNFGNVDGYDLNWVAAAGGGPLGLIDYLKAVGWQPTSTISAGTVCSVYQWGHAILGVGDGLCAAHNNARWEVDCGDGYYGTPDLCLNPPN